MTTQPTQPDLFEALRTLELPAGDYAIFGSGPLIIRGIIPLENDLDVIARGAAWDRAWREGTLVHLPEHGVDVASFLDGRITIGRSWAYGTPDIDALIDSAEQIDDLPFVRLSHVVEYKMIANRPKDLDHLGLLRTWEHTK